MIEYRDNWPIWEDKFNGNVLKRNGVIGNYCKDEHFKYKKEIRKKILRLNSKEIYKVSDFFIW